MNVLGNLRAENKLLRRKTLTGILEEIKSLKENFDKHCSIVSKPGNPESPLEKRAIKLDSDDEEGSAEEDNPVDQKQDTNSSGDAQQQTTCSNELIEIYGGVDNLIKALVLSISDPVEKCRELAYKGLSHLVMKCGKKTVIRALPCIISALVLRLAQPELIESSEEVRLIAIEFIEILVKKCQKELIPFIDDLVFLMLTLIGDPFHEARIKTCQVTSLIAKTLVEVFHYNSERLAKPFSRSLTHQQSRVRRAVVECIGDILQYGNHKSADTFLKYLIQRLFDPNPTVRKAVISVVGNWMLEFSDRYNYFFRFLPFMLTGVCDDSPDVCEVANKLWAKAGEKYLKENLEEYKDFVDFPAPPPKHYPKDVPRPNFGCRALAHREVCKLIPGVVHDITDWQESNRQKSAQLLFYLILNCEEKITMHVQPLFQCMFRACLDSNSIVIKYVLESSALLGYFAPISTCWPLLEEALHCNSSQGVLAVTYSYLKGVDPNELPRHLNSILETISSPDICRTLNQEKLYWIAGITETILALAPEAVAEQCSEVSFRLILIIGSMSTKVEITERAQCAMQILCHVCGFPRIDDLFGLYCGNILEEIRDANIEWTMNTPERLIFTSILSQAGSGIQKNIDTVLEILGNYLGPKRDPEVRLSLFTELTSILRIYSEMNEQSPEQMERVQNFVKTIIEDILSQNLVWRAGRSAAALRAAALNCLLTVLLGNLLSAETLLSMSEDVSSGCIALLDDQLHLNRLFSVKCLGELSVACKGKLGILQINRTYPELLKRMDDENKDVRLAAAKAISQIYENLPEDYTVERFNAYFDHTVGALIIHLDDRDEGIQNAVFDALAIIGSVAPNCVIEKCESFKSKHRTPDNCNKLIRKLQEI